MTESTCAFCDRSTDPRFDFCSECVERLTIFVGTSSPSVLVRLWPVLDDPTKIDHSNADDFETHADLAVAYLEMGLTADATSEALLALRAPIYHPAASRAALSVLLNERVTPKQIVNDLRRILRSRGWG